MLDRLLFPPSDFSPSWHREFEGIDRASAVLVNPDLAVYCLRINLTTPGVSVLVTPPEMDIPENFEARLRTTSSFLKSHKLQAAINATPFYPVSAKSGQACSLAGLSISDHRLISPQQKKYAAIVFFDNGTVSVLSGSEVASLPGNGSEIKNAVGGFSLLLRNGSITRDRFEGVFKMERTPRSAIGVSANGSVLYLLVIDGKKPGHSVGATFLETAAWLAAFGADSGLMLDGGGSSTLVLADENGQPRVANIPVQGVIPYIERPVANQIGIYARPVKSADAK
jgi:exopolysaccharide biosynthesis protein